MAYRQPTVWDSIYALVAPFIASTPAAIHIWTHSAGSDRRRRFFEHKEKRVDIRADAVGRKVLSYLASRQAKLITTSEFERAKVLHTLSGCPDRPYERVNVFITNDYAVHRAGTFTLSGNVHIGLPASFTADKLEKADVDAFLKRFYPNFSLLETRSAYTDETMISRDDMNRLQEALFLTENARTFVLLREMFHAKKWRVHFDALISFTAFSVPLIFCKTIHNRLRQLLSRRSGGSLLIFLAHSFVAFGSFGVSTRVGQFYHRYVDLRSNTDVLNHFRAKRKAVEPNSSESSEQPRETSQSQSAFASVFPKSASQREKAAQQQQQPPKVKPEQKQSKSSDEDSGIIGSIKQFPNSLGQYVRDSRAEALEKWERDGGESKVHIDKQFDLEKSPSEHLGVTFDQLAAGATEYYSKLATINDFKRRFRIEKRYEESLAERVTRLIHEFFVASPAAHLRAIARAERDEQLAAEQHKEQTSH